MCSYFTGYREENIPVSDWRSCLDNYIRNQTSLNDTWCGKEQEMEENIKANLTQFNAIHSDTDFGFICGPNITRKGDSGGPLMRRDENGYWTLIAIVRGVYILPAKSDPCDKSTIKNVTLDDNQLIVPFLQTIHEIIDE